MSGTFPMAPFPPLDSGWVGPLGPTESIYSALETFMGIVYDETRDIVSFPLDEDATGVQNEWGSDDRATPSMAQQRFTATGFDNGASQYSWGAMPDNISTVDSTIKIGTDMIGFEIEFDMPLNPTDTGRVELWSGVEFYTSLLNDYLGNITVDQKPGSPNEHQLSIAVEAQNARTETLTQERNIIGVLYDGDSGVARFWLNGTEITPAENVLTLTEFLPIVTLNQNETLAANMQGETMGVRFITDPYWITTPFPAGTLAIDKTTPIAKEPDQNIAEDSVDIILAHIDFALDVVRLVEAPGDLTMFAGGTLELVLATTTYNDGCLTQLNDPEGTVQALPLPVGFSSGEYTLKAAAEKLQSLDSERRFRQETTAPATIEVYGAANSSAVTVPAEGITFRAGFFVRNILDDTGVVTGGVALSNGDDVVADVQYTVNGLTNSVLSLRAAGVEDAVILDDIPIPVPFSFGNAIVICVKQDAVDVYDAAGTQLGSISASFENVFPAVYVQDRPDGTAGRQMDVAIFNPSSFIRDNVVNSALYFCEADPAGEEGIDVDARDLEIITTAVGTFAGRMGENVIQDPISGIDHLLSLGYVIGLATELDARTGQTDGMDAVKDAFTTNTKNAFTYQSMGRWGCLMKSLYPEATNFFHSMLRVVYGETDPGNLPEWLEEANFDVLCKYLGRSIAEGRLWYLVNIR